MSWSQRWSSKDGHLAEEESMENYACLLDNSL
jgi:hypothetical protein